MVERKIEIVKISWNWYYYHVASGPITVTWGHGTRRQVKEAVSNAILRHNNGGGRMPVRKVEV